MRVVFRADTKLTFDERLGLLVDAECLARENKRLSRLLKEAKLRLGHACIEDIKYAARRELDKAQVRQLATCLWVQQHQNVLVTGMTVIAVLCFFTGLILDTVTRGRREVRRLAYLSLAAPGEV